MKSSSWKLVRVAAGIAVLLGTAATALVAAPGKYLAPCDVVAAKDGKSLFVLCAEAKQIAVVDIAAGKATRTIDMPAEPTGAALSPDGATLYVTCAAPEGTVAIVDTASGKITGSIPAGHTAIGPSVSPDGKRLYVCNRFDNDISVIDLGAEKEVARVKATREPIASAVTPDGKLVLVANHLPNDPADGYDVAAVVTLIDTETKKVSSIRLPNGSSSLRGICVSPDGKQAYVTHILARYQMPTTQLERGWMNTNALSIIDTAGRKLINTVLLDDVDLGAANPWGVACTADGKYICVAHAGTHELSVIDAPALLEKLAKMPPNEEAAAAAGNQYSGTYASRTAKDVPNDLAFLVDLRRRIRLDGKGPWEEDPAKAKIKGPRGLAVIGSKAYVAVYYSDVLGVVDLEPKLGPVTGTIALGPEPVRTKQRQGEILFHDARICFQHWQSCSSCHPDARVDALNWDLMNDGIGNPKNVKNMLFAHKTPPAMSSGIRPNAEAAVRSGITHIEFAVRPEEDAEAIDEYLKSLKPVPSPHLVNGGLSEAAQRGKALFESDKVACHKCHPAPLYTDKELYDVGSKGKYDRRSTFDTPSLVEVWRTAPYLHDGHYTTVKELLTAGKHGGKRGGVQGLTEQQIDDLVEFVLSL